MVADPSAAEKFATPPGKLLNLDGIRAYACLFVVVSHIPTTGLFRLMGAIGVALFFALSGFLMGHLYGRRSFGVSEIKHYAVARVARIIPIYWLTISLCILLSLFSAQDFPLRIDTLDSIIRHYGLGGNVGPFWTIPLEIQYYAFFVVIWFCLSVYSRMPYALLGLACVCGALLATNHHWPNLSLPNKLHFFLAGTLAGLLPRAPWKSTARAQTLTLLQGIALIGILFPLTQPYSMEAFYDSLTLSLVFALAIYVLSFDSRFSSALFATYFIRRIGHASFSIYLLHVLVIYYGGNILGLAPSTFHWAWLATAVLAVALPVLVSRIIEMPLQRTTRDYLERLFLRKDSIASPAKLG